MELIDNISRLLGDDLKRALKPGARLKVAASCFSMYGFESLKAELEQVDELHFIFTSPSIIAKWACAASWRAANSMAVLIGYFGPHLPCVLHPT